MRSFGVWIRSKWTRLYLKIVREKASPEYIARGWSIGMFFGCIIPLGGQLLLSIPTAFLLKGSKIGAVVGTLITNQVTIFFIYPAQCYAGAKILGMDFDYRELVHKLHTLITEPTFHNLYEFCRNSSELAAAFFLGGAIMALVLTPLTYWAVHSMVIRHRFLVEKRRAKRLEQLRARKSRNR